MQKWHLAKHNLNILDKAHYINRLNDAGVNKYFDVELRHPVPLSYLIDENGVIRDKFSDDILNYSDITD